MRGEGRGTGEYWATLGGEWSSPEQEGRTTEYVFKVIFSFYHIIRNDPPKLLGSFWGLDSSF